MKSIDEIEVSCLSVSFLEFVQLTLHTPVLLITVLLTLGVVLVNGWTDAPNAIATCVSTRSMYVRSAIVMAAVLNFAGVLVMTSLSATVAFTIYDMVDFGDDQRTALIALCAAMVAIVIWATSAWYFGIPTSESHALIAGISGAAIAISGGLSGINGGEWIKVVYGLVLSTLFGLAFGWLTVKIIALVCKNTPRQKTAGFFRKMQIAGAASMAFMHGAQDGQKFIGIFLLGMTLSVGTSSPADGNVPPWLMLLCSLVMGLGTSIGGYKIIKSVGLDMVKLEKYEGFAADIAGALSLLFLTLLGWPVSTTQTKTTSIMGVGAAKRLSNVNWSVVREMGTAWILTFPGCGLIGFFMAKLFLHLF